MQELQKLFGDRALTYAELEAALERCGDIKLANLAGDGYIDKEQYGRLEAQLAKALSARAQDAKVFEAQLTAQKRDAGIALALTQAQAKNLTAAKALLNLEEITLEGERLTGLDTQLQEIMRENPFLFGGAAQNPPPPTNGGLGVPPLSEDTAKWRQEAGLPALAQ